MTGPQVGRPAALLEPRPQGRVQRHTVEHIIDVLPYVQILDVPVPQVEDQLVESMQRLDTVTPVPVTESHSALWTSVVRRGRNSWWKCRLSCLSPLSSSSLPSRSLTFEFRLVVGVVVGVFKVFSQYRIQQRRLSRSLTFQFAAEDFKVFAQERFLHLHSQLLARVGRLVFAHFSARERSAGSDRQVHGHSSSAELSAHQMARAGVAAHSEPLH